MRLAIIGAGAAGLTAAYLLQDDHDVTVFEQEHRLGGHAHTVVVEQGEELVGIDAGFEFFSGRMFPTFTRLLGLLQVPLRRYPLTATFYTHDHRYNCLLPPVRNGRLAWAALKPRQVLDLLQFGLALHWAAPLMRARDPSVTLARFLGRLPVTQAFKRDFLAPFLLAGWCVEPDDFLRFSAYDVLSYSYWHRPAGLTPYIWTEVVGGTQTYVQALVSTLTRATVQRACPVVGLQPSGGAYWVRTADGGQQPFDQVVIATNAQSAARLLTDVKGAEALRRSLGQVEYFPTRIAVHGDPRLMPADRRFWSVVNIRYDGTHSANTVWKGWKSRVPIFRSWVTYAPRLPEPLYHLAEFDHPKVNAAYFQAQRELAPLQGQRQLWLAGVYLHAVDSHESAVLSAVHVARRLAPGSARLMALMGGT